MKNWNVIVTHSSTHEPLSMRLYLSQDSDKGSYIELTDYRNNESGTIRAHFMMRNDKLKILQKEFDKESSLPLKLETGWAEDQVWNYLQEISHMTREAQEALVPSTR